MSSYYIFAIVTGAVLSLIFIFLDKKTVRKEKTTNNKSFLIYVPVIFGTVNVILSVIFLISLIFFPDVFSKNITFENKNINFLYNIFSMYFYVLASPVSVCMVTLTIILKKNRNISGMKFLYCIITNITGAIVLMI
jgi:hypothetical protein